MNALQRGAFWLKNHHLKRSSTILVVYILTVVFVTLFAYGSLTDAFFLNDEWVYRGKMLTDGPFYVLQNTPLPELFTGRGRPLGTLFQNIFYFYFPYNVMPFVLFGLSAHIINCILLYVLALKLSKNIFISFFAGLFFCCSSVYIEGLNWVVCLIDLPGSSLFALSSLIFMKIFSEQPKKIYFFLSLFSAYISFLFKDISIYLFVLDPFLLAFYSGKKWLQKKNIYVYIFFLLPFLLSFLTRFTSSSKNLAGTASLQLHGEYLFRSLFHSVFYPVIGIGQILIPARLLSRLSDAFMHFEYGNVIPLIRDSHLVSGYIIGDILMLGIGFSVLVLFAVFYRVSPYKKVLLFSGIFYVLNFIPIAFYLIYRPSFFIESRYMYVPAMAFGIFILCLAETIRLCLVRNMHVLKKTITIVFVFCGVLYCYKQMMVVRTETMRQMYDQQTMKSLFTQLRMYSGVIPKQPIFFLTSDVDFYWHFNNKVPFLLGTGYMLLMTYYDTGLIPNDLISQRYLMGFGTQGYKKVGDKTFGYFWDREIMCASFRSDPALNKDQILGFLYKSAERKIADITDELKLYIEQNNCANYHE